MKYEDYLKELGTQICFALNEGDEEKRADFKYCLLEQIELLIELSKGRDQIVLTTAAFIDQCTKGEALEMTTALRDCVFELQIK